MALTRAQLLMGDVAQDTVLAGQVQAVIPGDGITILPDGTIEVNSQTARGLMRLGQTAAYADAAYNGYWWPTTVTAADIRKQITITGVDVDGYAILSWDDPDGIPWTLKGQLVVGTGINTQILLDPGISTSALVVDPTTASGLRWSDTSTSALLMPTGTSAQRPSPAVIGQTRFNTTNSVLEVYGANGWAAAGADWTAKGQLVVGTGVGTQTILDPGADTAVLVVDSTTTSGLRYTDTSTSAIQLPAGNDAARPAVSVRGQARFNTQSTTLEIYNGTQWLSAGGPVFAVAPIFSDGAIPSSTIYLDISTLPLLP